MPRRSRKALAAAAALVAALGGCDAAPDAAKPPGAKAGPATPLGVMSSLPLYWPLGAGIGEIAGGTVPPPWQRTALEAAYRIEPLDTLSPPAPTAPPLASATPPAQATPGPDASPVPGPLAGLERLAVIQPRGLSPSDNVALDDWVRAGGHLLLVLDPALTGEYDLPLGDPRRPVDSALIPPVVARWGLAVSFDAMQAPDITTVGFGSASLPLAFAGRIAITDPAAAACVLDARGAAARCKVGEGRVTLIADAAIFEHPELAGEGGTTLRAVMAEALK